MDAVKFAGEGAPSRGLFSNTGNGVMLQPVDIQHPEYTAVVDGDTAFWALVPNAELGEAFKTGGELVKSYREKAQAFQEEMNTLRFGLKPSAVYFNPTERCNLNCSYCYIPEEMRREGEHMNTEKLLEALEIFKNYFRKNMPEGRKPEVVFHGAEPMMNRDAVFEGIEQFSDDFIFGIILTVF